MKSYNLLMIGIIFLLFTACEATDDKKEPCDLQVYNTIEKTIVLSPENPSYDLTVASERGIIASSACHSLMSARYKWVDDSYDGGEPPIDLYCHTIWNYFLGPPAAYLDGDEWVTSVDAAEDKSNPGETSYGIEASLPANWDSSWPNVEVTLEVGFHIYDESAYD